MGVIGVMGVMGEICPLLPGHPGPAPSLRPSSTVCAQTGTHGTAVPSSLAERERDRQRECVCVGGCVYVRLRVRGCVRALRAIEQDVSS